jgi:hypothetical protein
MSTVHRSSSRPPRKANEWWLHPPVSGEDPSLWGLVWVHFRDDGSDHISIGAVNESGVDLGSSLPVEYTIGGCHHTWHLPWNRPLPSVPREVAQEIWRYLVSKGWRRTEEA